MGGHAHERSVEAEAESGAEAEPPRRVGRRARRARGSHSTGRSVDVAPARRAFADGVGAGIHPGAHVESHAATREEVIAAIRACGQIDELDQLIHQLEGLPSGTSGIQEITIGGADLGVQYEWAEDLCRIATTRRAELSRMFAPTAETADGVAQAVVATPHSTSVSTAPGGGGAVGVDVNGRVQFATPWGDLEIGATEQVRVGGSRSVRSRVRATRDRRGSTPRDQTQPEIAASGTAVELFHSESGEESGSAQAFQLRSVDVHGRGSGSIAPDRASGGLGLQAVFEMSYEDHPFSFDLNLELISGELSGDGFRLRSPSVEGVVHLPLGAQMSIRFTPNPARIAAFARTLFGAAEGGAVATTAATGTAEADTAATAARAGVADGTAAEGGGVVAAEGAGLTAGGMLVGAFIIGDVIVSSLQAVHESMVQEARGFDGAIAAGRTIGAAMEAMLRDVCTGYVAVMRGEQPPASDGGRVGGEQAQARIDSLLTTLPLGTLYANARATPDLYARVYAVAAPQFRTEARLLADEIGTHVQIHGPAAAHMARDEMLAAITRAANQTGATAPEGWHAPML